MKSELLKSGVYAGRLSKSKLESNFSDLHPPLETHEALIAADRCYFCFDAPCMAACPTTIDIPLFIRQISTHTPEAAAKTIFSQNIMGGICARVCPTETLCEEACVRNTAEQNPVEIGRLQRYATDICMETGAHPFKRAAPTGKKIAIIGAGPAGLSCAHRLAMHGHDVVVFDKRNKAGGLNEFGIARYKSTHSFAENEVAWLLEIGGITIKLEQSLGDTLQLDDLSTEYDAVFLGLGLGAVNPLNVDGDDKASVVDAVDFISDLRQASDLNTVPIGRDVVVIGGGMTAIDAAVQAKLLGALNVSLVYRRGPDRMNASFFERDLAASKGVQIIYNASPIAIHGNGAVREIEFEYTDSALNPTGEKFKLPADQVFRAIGQKLNWQGALKLEGRKIAVDEHGQTSHSKIWAGGDCASGGDDLTVTAVAEGRDAAEHIHMTLMNGQ